ncbi:hypothetical protein ABKN59_008325 [Abortiporus biennis]
MPEPKHFDPRMGDEGDEGEEPKLPQRSALHTHHTAPNRHVRLADVESDESEGSEPDSNEKKEPPKDKKDKDVKTPRQKLVELIPFDFQWIPDNWNWSKIKPVIRNAIMGWVSVLFVIIPSVEKAIGQASFLIIIAAFLDPPTEPFIEIVEREIILLVCIGSAWGWSCLAMLFASLAREHTDYSIPLSQVVDGQFIEAGPTVIMAVFMFLGCSFFLYLKAWVGPGPFVFVMVFSCICIDISITTAVLFPYPFYRIGQAIMVPLAVHAALAIISSAVVFPSTITAKYTHAFGSVLEPLHAVLSKHREVLKSDPSSEEFGSTASAIAALVNKSEGALAPAGAASRLLKRDIVYGRFGPADLHSLEYYLRRLVTRSNGMGIYFTLIDPTREKFPVTPAPSVPATPAPSVPPTPIASPEPSRPPTPEPQSPTNGHISPPGTPTRRRNVDYAPHMQSPLRQSLSRHFSKHLSHHSHPHSSHHDTHLHFSLLQLAHSLSLSRVPTPVSSTGESAVGVFESQRYLAIEANRLSVGRSPEYTSRFTELLSESCDDLLEKCQAGLTEVQNWIGVVRRSSFGGKEFIAAERKKRLKTIEGVRDELKEAIETFRKVNRHRVLDPYRSAFDPRYVGAGGFAPPHRYLFHCYVYEYHAMQFAIILGDLIDEICRLETERQKAKLWLPTLPLLANFLQWSRWETSDDNQEADDENPDIVQGLEPDSEWAGDLGTPVRRDPDALPPKNFFQLVMYWIYWAISSLASGNTLFALKAGVLTILLSLPTFLKQSASFAYAQRFTWGIFMGQLTLARWRGDTTFGLVSRVLATFFGCITGLVMWYISTGSGHGNPYGLAATCAVAFPFFFFARLYWSGPPMTNIIFFVTTALVIGYSWQNTHFPVGFSAWGWELAWRRFILVVAGVTAAFLFSFLPPSTTLRSYQRRMMSTTVSELGSVYCSIVSFANTRNHSEADKSPIIQSLIAIRLKLKRSLVLRRNVVYEFSLRGSWPSERYHKICEIQLQIAFLLSHLMSVVEHLEPAWTRAFLRRTRFLDADFQGDILAVISLISTSLRTGNPLPQITPCPLLDRFMSYTHGLNVIRQEADDDYGLPRTMTIDTLENEQYLCFTVGVTTAFGIVMRLDRLMVATKELVVRRDRN